MGPLRVTLFVLVKASGLLNLQPAANSLRRFAEVAEAATSKEEASAAAAESELGRMNVPSEENGAGSSCFPTSGVTI